MFRFSIGSAVACICLVSTLTFAQDAPERDWSTSERQFIQDMRNLYQKQGATLTTDQEEQAVKQLRDQQRPKQNGIPQSEWTPREAQWVREARVMLEKQGTPFTDEQACIAVQRMRDQFSNKTGYLGVMQALAKYQGGGISGSPSPVPVTQIQPAQSWPPSLNQPQLTQVTSENELAAQIGKSPALASPFKVKESRDGFVIDDQPVIDPEGQIKMYSQAHYQLCYTGNGAHYNMPSPIPPQKATGIVGNSGRFFCKIPPWKSFQA